MCPQQACCLRTGSEFATIYVRVAEPHRSNRKARGRARFLVTENLKEIGDVNANQPENAQHSMGTTQDPMSLANLIRFLEYSAKFGRKFPFREKFSGMFKLRYV